MAGVKGMHKRASTSPAAAAAIRARIQGGQIADRLQKHTLGEIEMTPSQIQAGLGLLKKVVGDVTSGPGDDGEHLHDVRVSWLQPQ